MTDRQELLSSLNNLLQPERFKDYCPNGLQVEGRSEVQKIVSGVTASLAFIEAAVAAHADALIVHHGLFWRGHDGCVTGWMRKRLGMLMEHNINLFAYHLPMDAHPVWGNNAQLGNQLGLQILGQFGEQQLGCLGSPTDRIFQSTQSLADHVQTVLHHPVVVVAGNSGPVQKIAWCTGGAQGYFEAAIAAGADAFITGEISEPQAHYAREYGVSYLACGHHATERYGAPAVGAFVAAQLGLEHVFIDIDNPA
jgi:dinuclear metal center YbgI/SA1388 family protein